MEQPNNIIRGIHNPANLCYLLCTLQIMMHTTELTHLFVLPNKTSNPPLRANPEKKETQLLLFFFNELLRYYKNKGNHIIDSTTYSRIATILNTDFGDFSKQHDMIESFLFLFNAFHSSVSSSIDYQLPTNIIDTMKQLPDQTAYHCYSLLKNTYAKEYSPFMDSFYGIYVCEIWDTAIIERKSLSAQLFCSLPLSIKNQNMAIESLYDCLQNHCDYELMYGENAWYDDVSKMKMDVKKRVRFWNFPKIFVISFQRFQWEKGISYHKRKINNSITFPLFEPLDISPFVYYPNGQSCLFDVYAICCHLGTNAEEGHYVCYLKLNNTQWVLCNDDQIINVDIGKMLPTIYTTVYCLFYRKR